jgi:hypothetical protein
VQTLVIPAKFPLAVVPQLLGKVVAFGLLLDLAPAVQEVHY